jgi:NAD(P)-dependent dehydrogenase (short-subunit alcohol dehydrogenase family)
MASQFKDYAVVVTGAGIGIGYTICQQFAEAEAYVALVDIDADVATQSAQKINDHVGHERVTAYGVDVANPDAMREMVADFASKRGRFDVMIANAGITNYGDFLTYSPTAFDRVMAVNLKGTFFTAQAAANEMIARKTENGRIVLMSSVTGVQAHPFLSAYGMTKAGIKHLASILAAEIGMYQITVNAICPGIILTERTQADDPNLLENWEAVTPSGRVGYPEDIANAALFLSAPQSRHINGQTIIVDGGWSNVSRIPVDAPELPEESTKLR